MTEDSEALTSRLVAAIERGELPEIVSLVAESAVVHLPGETSVAGEGREVALAVFGGLARSLGEPVRVAVHDADNPLAPGWPVCGPDDPVLALRVEHGRIVEIWQRPLRPDGHRADTLDEEDTCTT